MVLDRRGLTYKTAKDLITRFDGHGAASVVDRCVYCRLTVGAKGAVEANTFHSIVQDLVVTLGRVHLCILIDIWEMLFPFVREIIVEELCEDL